MRVGLLSVYAPEASFPCHAEETLHTADVSAHVHGDFTEITFVRGGSALCRSAAGECLVRRGDVLMAAEGSAHGFSQVRDLRLFTVRFRPETNSRSVILAALDRAFREKVHPSLLVRRIGISLNDPREEDGAVQTDLFSDPGAREREHRLQEAMIEVRRRFGRNALVRGMNMLDGATAVERNQQIGGHRA